MSAVPDPTRPTPSARVQTPQSLDAGTEYVILKQTGTHADLLSWQPLAKRQTARSTESAIRAVGEAGTFIAIPLRSWKSYTLTAKTETKYVLEEATS